MVCSIEYQYELVNDARFGGSPVF